MEMQPQFELDPIVRHRFEKQRRLQIAIEWSVELVGRGGDPRAILKKLLAA